MTVGDVSVIKAVLDIAKQTGYLSKQGFHEAMKKLGIDEKDVPRIKSADKNITKSQ